MSNILEELTSVECLKGMSKTELENLSQEIREFIINHISKTGGHLASNLGVVELTLALHSVFDSPKDKIIWDVGHQSYVHKILTGRKDKFATLRQYGGLSGFPKRKESHHDIFETGHSSTSISAALGIAKARDITLQQFNVVAVLGDGAFSGGMALEAINHAGHDKTKLIVVLNDNEMSIAQNVGALSSYLNRIRIDPRYFKVKKDIEWLLNSIPALGKSFFKMADKVKDSLKYLLVSGMLFEELGFKYYGPIDGHDVETLKSVLKRAKSVNGPVLIHVITKKGKGYKPAEQNPDKYHGVSAFDIESGKSKGVKDSANYSFVAGDSLCQLAKTDNRITAITAAMPEGTGLSSFAKDFKTRFFDVGIAEQHAVTFAAGLAAQGLKPYFAVYSTFLQRAYDQILHDVCLQNLDVTLLIDRAGLVGEDGETHHGAYDLSYLMHMPNMTILSPRNGQQLREMIDYSGSHKGPLAIRYPRGGWMEIQPVSPYFFKLGKWEVLLDKTDDGEVALIGSGRTIKSCMDAAGVLRLQGVSAGVYNATTIKPLDRDMLNNLSQNYKLIAVVEDNAIIGGLGSVVLQYCNDNKAKANVITIGLPDAFIEHGNIDILYRQYGLDGKSIAEQIAKEIGRENGR